MNAPVRPCPSCGESLPAPAPANLFEAIEDLREATGVLINAIESTRCLIPEQYHDELDTYVARVRTLLLARPLAKASGA